MEVWSKPCCPSKDIQRFLDRFTEFFDRWGFKMSAAKTVAIVFTKKNPPEDIKLHVNAVLQSECGQPPLGLRRLRIMAD